MSRPDGPDAASENRSPTPELLSKVEALLSNIELLDIRPCSIEAFVEEGVGPKAPVESLTMNHEVSFAVSEGFYSGRYDYGFELKGSAGKLPIGTIKFSLLIDYRVSEGFNADPEAADFFATTTGYFAAYPYARELFESIVTRLHFDPIVLGLIRRDSIRPGSISIVPDRQAKMDAATTGAQDSGH